MKYFIQLLILVVNIITCNSQNNNDYFFSSEIEAKLRTDTITRNLQHYAVNYINIGDYKNTLLVEEEFVEKFKGLNRKEVTVDGTFLSYHPVNAIDAIIEKSLRHQIVIINEAHYSAQNRVFTRALLAKLYRKGYKTLFVEDLVRASAPKTDTLLNMRKYPLMSTGYYMKEPQYGNMIRKALQLKYKVLPYEYIPNDSVKDPMKSWLLREQGQAQNILDYLKKYPKEKLIIHCGYGHLGEKLHEGNIGMMGALLKHKSGLDPFTISQTLWLETFSDKTKNPYRKLIDINPPKEISIFKNANGDYFSSDKENYDVEVYFPKTKYINGRPDWLMMTEDRMHVDIPFSEIELNFPYLIKAYHNNEKETNAVAADIIEIISNNDKKALVLEKGNYNLVVEDIKGNTQNLKLAVK